MSNSQLPWADSPFPLIPLPSGSLSTEGQHKSVALAHMMVHVHNCFLRTLNAIYQQAPNVTKPEDIEDLLQLTRIWADQLHHHHDTEESLMFPELEAVAGEKGILDGNIDQHRMFMPGLIALQEYVKTTKPEAYNAEKLRRIIDGFGNILQEHLSDEIPTLLALKKYDSGEIDKVLKKVDAHAQKTSDKYTALPFILGSHDNTFQGSNSRFPIPWFVVFMASLFFARPNKNCWRFLPCTIWGSPQPLPFAVPAQN